MGRRGPPPKPTALRIAEGNPAKRPLNTREPTPEQKRPSCPSWLDDDGKACWREIVPQLEKMGLLTRIDRQALMNYCDTFARWKRAVDFIRKHGEVIPIKTEDGKAIKYLQQVPQVAIAKNLLAVLRGYQQDFGLTPAARSRLIVPGDGEPDELDAFVGRLRGIRGQAG